MVFDEQICCVAQALDSWKYAKEDPVRSGDSAAQLARSLLTPNLRFEGAHILELLALVTMQIHRHCREIR